MNDAVIKKLRIIRIIQETADAKTFVVEPLGDWKPVYRSGQFLTLVFQNHLGEQRRSFSISSSHVVGEPLAFTVKKLDNGEFSRHLIYKAKAGDVLDTSGISGFFVLPEDTSGKQFCFLAAGSGITPCFSLIKTLLKTTEANMILLYSNRSEADTIFHEALLQLKEQYAGRLLIYFMFSNHPDVLQKRLSHWVLTHFVEQHLPAPVRKHTLFYICGPYDYMLMAGISLKSNGVSGKQIIKEDFYPLPRLLKPKPPDLEAHKVTIRIGHTRHELVVQYPNTITASGKKAGITLPYSCESGQCGSCVATCTSGKIWMAYNEVLTDDEIAKGRVLTCQGYPVGGDAAIVFE
ncbi:flavin reductase family protein [Niabella drilacis]|uniref:Ring-1,2-phenylacetyl-CoA epoxidase subunit PaaE n=1 Tax=Niabella drilacis (strain DSM 25811 / CCM 8410 / CCUG 62505 / LMG 26954 / E90) TaxID=1285928 RepID=A0A1G6JP31_NIADE|nr:iron-sulfur cluster-binding domain-containing protein [Niabella drilacis]SDC20438.1 ring-1,2-phenylacetyl-CoA epoxidase subunit PaaE [Niabella drilacis]